jgi:hypothetical protein
VPVPRCERTRLWRPSQKEAILTFEDNDMRRLQARLRKIIGTEEADILMERLPPFTWSELTTKQDIEKLRMDFKHELEKLRMDFKHELAEQRINTKHDIEFSAIATRTEIENSQTGMHTELEKSMTEMRNNLERSILETRHSVDTMKLELTATMERGFRNQSWKMFTAIMSSQLVTISLVGLLINSLR